MPVAQSDSERADERYAWRVLSVTSLGSMLTGLNSSTLDVGLPAISRHFHASPSQASWILLSYMLVNTVLILVFGRLADILGRRQLYIAGLGIFTASSLGCGFAPNPTVLIALRATQAIGAAAIITNTTAQLVDVFPRRLVGLAVGLNVTVISAAKVSGPIVGGAVVTALGWRWVFLFNVPVGVVGLIWAALTLRPGAPAAPKERFDVAGAVVSTAWLTSVVLMLTEGGARGWTNPLVLGAATTSVVLFPVLVQLMRRRRDPLVDLALFRDRERAMAYLATFLLALSRLALVLLMSLFLQAAQGLDAFAAGLRVTPLAAGMMLAAPIAGRLAARIRPQVLSTFGVGLTGSGLLILALGLTPTTGDVLIAIALLAVGLGTGFFLPPNTNSIMVSVGPASRGVANGFRSMLQNTGGLVGTALALAIVTTPLDPEEKRAAYSGTLSRLPGRDIARFADAYRVALFVLVGLCVAAGVASSLRGARRRTPIGQPDRTTASVAD